MFYFVWVVSFDKSWHLFIHILHGCVTGTGAIIWLPQCQWRNHKGYGWKTTTTTTTKHIPNHKVETDSSTIKLFIHVIVPVCLWIWIKIKQTTVKHNNGSRVHNFGGTYCDLNSFGGHMSLAIPSYIYRQDCHKAVATGEISGLWVGIIHIDCHQIDQ